MNEAKVIVNTSSPRTRQSLATDLFNAGLNSSMTVIVHSSLSSLGWVCGGSVAVVQALMDVITPAGNLIMPTHSGDLSDPAIWQQPPVPREWWTIIRETMPAFDPKVTPTRGMGQIVETFRTWENVRRSSHPQLSFAAWGKDAENIISHHSLDYSLGEKSPLARLYDLNAWVLLLGVGYENCTSFHLAEYRVGQAQEVRKGAPILEAGRRVWKWFMDIDIDNSCFLEMGEAFEQTKRVQLSTVGSAQTKLFNMRNAVDFAVSWLRDHPTYQEEVL
ncbi:aminoglycoside N(3)-acetyltransferase [Anabaena sp. FACHB-709]|uniref:Aminoglycoside N(3)-acetyltransferase n=2 Tax=Nostocaceae TaxID=1162 RepID=A0A1Z4KUD3_ANAVA|nr:MULTISPECIES: AAC(3) family N-acetyltransferase [Nostocaceae]BAY72503.1 aminoglycoside N3'-acetyltransferase [Trichormus variabilis NIES-23]HBW29462.1 AAC(3) family N-acetyltransferase [Nostoc sp. UBA8866]MBD2170882.1 AAC(3) family N-acetyltransferase [Anabaena cylindrica FACHB-318]MBD2262667.1 AAC(3) family N-acetyltransferase [Anabaena sp. FACHB-709]MBD2272214.1 AAC(3) family N-acetyltransferase [Nostoc sp. PCC 7120 = FACHB-418]